jgi:hypothetical protein
MLLTGAGGEPDDAVAAAEAVCDCLLVRAGDLDAALLEPASLPVPVPESLSFARPELRLRVRESDRERDLERELELDLLHSNVSICTRRGKVSKYRI